MTSFPPAPVLPVKKPAQITYYFFDLMTRTLLATLPMDAANFGMRFNTPGSFAGSLNLASEKIQTLGPKSATVTGRSLLIIDVGGVPIWGGLVWTRDFTKSTRIASFQGQEAWSYWVHRMQPVDYTNPPLGPYWAANPAPAEVIAAQVIFDAQRSTLSGFGPDVLSIALDERMTNSDPIVASFPITQLQSVDQLVTTVMNGGYGTGFDFTTEVAWSDGPGSPPIFTVVLSYPRAGAVGATSGITISVAGEDVDYKWTEDSTIQAWVNYGTGGPSGTLQNTAEDTTPGAAGWPLLEATTSYAEVNTQDAIVAASESDLAVGEWPVCVPVITVKAFGVPSITDIVIASDARCIFEPDEWFPEGEDTTLRIVGIDVKIPQEGVATMDLTMNTPPALAPVPPPPGL